MLDFEVRILIFISQEHCITRMAQFMMVNLWKMKLMVLEHSRE